jgi:hypothetical protein
MPSQNDNPTLTSALYHKMLRRHQRQQGAKLKDAARCTNIRYPALAEIQCPLRAGSSRFDSAA